MRSDKVMSQTSNEIRQNEILTLTDDVGLTDETRPTDKIQTSTEIGLVYEIVFNCIKHEACSIFCAESFH